MAKTAAGRKASATKRAKAAGASLQEQAASIAQSALDLIEQTVKDDGDPPELVPMVRAELARLLRKDGATLAAALGEVYRRSEAMDPAAFFLRLAMLEAMSDTNPIDVVAVRKVALRTIGWA